MKILKPPWVNHNDKPIFSIDVHPDGTRFATAGQGDSSGRITIWNVLPLISLENEKNSSLPKMLCQMDNHFACVNCVRWSNAGTFLASAGDDKLIMIWRYAGGSSKVFGSSQENLESWRCIYTLRGHSGDVLDLSWSPQDKYLATCSVDNTAIIWNALKFPEQLRVLKGHMSMVKGVTWDPIGKYVATQSDDKTLIVWRTSDWQQDKVIREPFAESNGTTHVLRLGWSPDGTYLVSAHAMNNMGPTAQIIARDGWDTGMDFVGHRKAVSCVRFNPKLLRRSVKVKKKNKEEWVKYCCCAVGSRDSSCSVWLTALRRPLVVLHDLFSNSVIDLAWNGRGTQLFLCSSDGTIAFVEFTKEEIGTALSDDEKNKVLCGRYGKSTVLNGSAPTRIIENAELLKLHQQNLSNTSASLHDRTSSVSTPAPRLLVNGYHTPDKSTTSSVKTPSGVPNTPSKQIETRTKDGRRRITPIFLSPPPAVADIAPPIFTSTNEISKIVIEHASSDDASLFARPQANESKSPVNVGKNKAADSGEDDNMAAIKPMSSAEAKARASPSKQKLNEQTKAAKSKPSQVSSTKSAAEPAKEVINRIAVKRKAPPPQASKKSKKDSSSPVSTSTAASAAASATPGAAANSVLTTSVQQQPSEVAVSPLPIKHLNLPVPEVKKTLTYQVSDDGWTLDITVTNSLVSTGSQSISSLHCTSQDSSWSAMLNQSIISVQASRHLVCISCKDHLLSVYNTSGQTLLPSIKLDSDVSYLCVNKYHCMVITSASLLSLWDFQAMRCVLKSIDLSPLLRTTNSCNGKPVEKISLSRCFLSETNVPCVLLSNSNSYIYHADLQSWLLFNQSDDIIRQYSSHEVNAKPETSTFGAVSALSARLCSSMSDTLPSHMTKTDAAVHEQCTLSHIQQQMAVCRAMNSPSEFKVWLLAYIRYLTKHDKESTLRELCSQCAASVYKSVKSSVASAPSNLSQPSSSTQLMNLDRVSLLRELLPIIGSNLKLQRLYTEYSDILDIMQSGLG